MINNRFVTILLALIFSSIVISVFAFPIGNGSEIQNNYDEIEIFNLKSAEPEEKPFYLEFLEENYPQNFDEPEDTIFFPSLTGEQAEQSGIVAEFSGYAGYAPTWTSMTLSVSCASSGQIIIATANGEADGESDTLRIDCTDDGSTPTTSNNGFCSTTGDSSPYALSCNGVGDPGDALETVKCRMHDGSNYSDVKSDTYTADNTAPTGTVLGFGTIATTSIVVTASGASDAGCSNVHEISPYYIDRTAPTAANSGWGLGSWTNNSPALSKNTQYTYRARVRDGILNTSGYTSTQSKYTLAEAPASAPIVDNPSGSSLDVNPSSGIGNPSSTLYAIDCTGANCPANGWIKTDGTFTSSAQWQTDSTWGTIPVIELDAGTEYCFQSKAKNGDNVETSLSGSACGTTSTAPDAPTIAVDYNFTYPLNAELGAVDVRWSNVASETGYKLYRSTDNSSYSLINSPAANVTYYSDVDLPNNTTYWYKIKSTNGAGDSGDSNIDTVVIPDRNSPINPTLTLTPQNNSNNRIDASWTDNGDYSSEWPYATQIDPSNLKGYWRFEENTGTNTLDLSGNGNDGTISGADWNSSGKRGNGLNFNDAAGNEYVSTGITSHPTSFTVSAWAMIDNTANDYETIFSKFTSGPFNGFFLRKYGSTLSAYVYNAGTGYGSSSTFTVGKWTHWTMSFDGTTIRLYKNGELVDNDPGTMGSNATAMLIGGNYAGTETFDGQIDEVQYHTSALTPEQVRAKYMHDSLVGYWGFEGGSLLDSSSEINAGSAVGGINCSGDPGIMGDGCTFGGSGEYVDIIAVDNQVDSYQGTISAWAYPTSTASNRYIIAGIGTGTNRYYVQWNNDDLRVFRGNPGVAINLDLATTLNQWYHIVMTWEYDGTTQTIKGYLDGDYKGSNTFTGGAGTGGSFRIGRWSTDQEFPGHIDEVMFYDTPLSYADINKLYQAGKRKFSLSRSSTLGGPYIPVNGAFETIDSVLPSGWTVTDTSTGSIVAGDSLDVIGSGSWRTTAFTYDTTLARNVGVTYEGDYNADVLRDTMIGFKDNSGSVSYSNGVHNIRFHSNGNIHIYEDYRNRGVVSTWAAGNTYHWKIILKQTGALYYVDNVLIYDSYYSTESNLKPYFTQRTAGLASYDNLKITVPTISLSLQDTGATDNATPATMSAPTVTSSTINSCTMSYSAPSDNGTTYYYTLDSVDDFRNASNLGADKYASGILVDAGFENACTGDGCGGWTGNPDTGWNDGWAGTKTIDTTVSHTGNNSWKVAGAGFDAGETPGSVNTGGPYQDFTLANTTFLIGGWFKTDTAATASTNFRMCDGTEVEQTFTASDGWVNFEGTCTDSAGALASKIHFFAGSPSSASSSVWMDDLYIKEIKSATVTTGLAATPYTITGTGGGSDAASPYTAGSLTANTSYTYSVKATDVAGNIGTDSSNDTCITLPATPSISTIAGSSCGSTITDKTPTIAGSAIGGSAAHTHSDWAICDTDAAPTGEPNTCPGGTTDSSANDTSNKTSWTPGSDVAVGTYYVFTKYNNSASGSGGDSAYSASCSFTIEADTSPTLTVDYNSTYALNSEWGASILSWSNLTGESAYKIFRSTDNSTFDTIENALAADTTSYNDLDLSDNTTYYYKVAATISATDYNSSVVSVVTSDREGPSVSTLTLTPDAGNNRIDVSWTIPDDNSSEWPQVVQIDPSNVAGHWRFEENSGTTTYDLSGNGNDGTLTNSPTWTTGKIGNGLDFADAVGAQYVTTGITSHPTKFTVSAWVIIDNTDNDYETIFSKFTSGPFNGFFLRKYGSNLSAYVYNAGTGYGSSSKFTVGKWTHWTMSYDGITIRLYKDGELVDNDPGTLGSNATAMLIGGNYAGSETFDGKIDEVSYYTSTLTQEQIRAKYMQGALVGYYTLNESTGTTAYDSSIKGFDGIHQPSPYDPAIVTGRMGNALQFDGDTNVVISGVDWGFVNGTPHSFAAWINLDAGNGGRRTIIGQERSTRITFQVLGGENIELRHDDGGAVSTGNVPEGEWAHVAVTYDGIDSADNTKFYINGVLSGTGNSFNSQGVSTTWYIGHEQRFSEDFLGKIDEVMVFDSNISAADINNLYNAGVRKYNLSRSATEGGTYSVIDANTLLTSYTDTGANDTTAPSGNTISSITPTIDQLTVNYSTSTDAGNTYYYTLDAIDDFGNESNLFTTNNSGFEQGDTTDYAVYWSANCSATSAEAHTGNYSLACTGATAGGAYHDNINVLTNGEKYLVSAWAKSTAGATGTFNIWVHDVAGAGDVTSTNSTPGTEWTYYSTVFTATSTLDARVHLDYDNGSGTIYADNVKIQKIETDTITTGLHATPYFVDCTSGACTTGVEDWVSGTSDIATGLDVNASYCFKVRSRDAAANGSALSAEVCKFTLAEQPTISSVTCTSNSCSVAFSMGTNPAATEYYITEKSGNTGATDSGWATAASPYSDTGLDAGTQYCYTIKSRNGDNTETSETGQTCDTTGSGNPTLTVDYNSTYPLNSDLGASILRWNNLAGESAYKLFRSTDNYNFTTIENALAADTVSYNDLDLSDNTTYYYKVAATISATDYNSGVVSVVIPDRNGPISPTLTLTPNAGNNRIDTSWTDVNDSSSEWPQTVQIDPSNIVGHWRFESDIANISTSEHTSYTQGSLSYSAGKIGNALDLDGTANTGAELLRDANAGLYESTFSYSFWFKASTTSSGVANARLISRDCSDYFCLLMDQDDGAGAGKLNHTYAPSTGTGNLTISNPTGWHHVVATWDVPNTTGTLYLDGVQIHQNTSIPAFTASAKPVVIGGNTEADNDISGSEFKGLVDEVVYYNITLTPDQVKEKYLQDSLLGYWRFDEGTGTEVEDSTVNDNNGTITNATWTSGKIGNALTFDGSSTGVNTGNGAILNDANAMSISSWINVNSGAADLGTIAMEWTGYNLAYRTDGGSNDYFWFELRGTDASTRDITSSNGYYNISEETWHHVVATYDGADMRIFMDGVLMKEENVGAFTITDDASPLRIGEHTDSGSRYFDGEIDEVMIFDANLSATDINKLYHAGVRKFGLSRATASGGTYTPVNGLFDDFTDNSIDTSKWTVVDTGAGTVTETSGALELVSTDSWTTTGIYSTPNFSRANGLIFEGDVNGTHGSGWTSAIFGFKDTTGNIQYTTAMPYSMYMGYHSSTYPNGAIGIYNYSTLLAIYTTENWAADEKHHFKIIAKPGGGAQYFWDDKLLYDLDVADDTSILGVLKAGIDPYPAAPDKFTFDNLKVTPLLTTTSLQDTAATDTIVPSVPGSLTVDGETTSTLDVNWTASTDDGNTFYYTLEAFDDFGNESNLIGNPGFEKSTLQLPFTSAISGGTISIDSTTSYTGDNSLKFVATAGAYTAPYNDSSAPLYTLTEDSNFLFTVWAKTDVPTTDQFRMYIFCLDSAYDWITLNSEITTLTTNWQQYSVSHQCENSAHDYVSVRLDNATNGEAINWYDDVKLVKVESATVTTGLKQYMIQCTSKGGGACDLSDTIITSPTITNKFNSLDSGTEYCFTVLATDNVDNNSAATSAVCRTTLSSSITLSSSSHGNEAAWYNDQTPTIATSGSFDHIHYWVTQNASESAADIYSNGTQDADGSITDMAGITSDGVWYVHAVSHNADHGGTATDAYKIQFDDNVPTLTSLTVSSWSGGVANYTNDVTPPFAINGAADTGGSGLYQMAFSCNDSTWSSWTAYATTHSSFNVRTEDGCSDAEGSKTIYVKLKDNADNESASSATAAFTLDQSAPTSNSISVHASAWTGGVTNYTNDNTPQLTIASTNAYQMKFSCDDSTWTSNEAYATSISNFAISNFDVNSGSNGCAAADGSKTVYVVFRDEAGNNATSASTTAFTLDHINPPLAFISPADAFRYKTGNDPSLVSRTTPDTSGLQDCWARIGTGNPPTSPLREVQGSISTTDCTYSGYAGLSEGTYYWDFNAMDKAGNWSSYSSTRTIISDNTAPTVPSTFVIEEDSTSPYWDNVNNSKTELGFVALESGEACKWNLTSVAYASMSTGCTVGGTDVNCAFGNLTQTNTGGQYLNRYHSCIDSVANDYAAQQTAFGVDWSNPTTSDNSSTTIVAPTYNVTITEADNASNTGADITTVYCKGVACTPGTSVDNGGTVAFTASDRGATALRYYSTDLAGNVQSTVTKTININQLPSFSAASDDAGTIQGGTTVTVTTTSDDPDAGQTQKLVICKTSGVTGTDCDGGAGDRYCTVTTGVDGNDPNCDWTSESDDSTHTWYAYVFDSLNEGSSDNPRTGSYTNDSTDPIVSPSTPADGAGTSDTTPTFTGTANENISNCQIQMSTNENFSTTLHSNLDGNVSGGTTCTYNLADVNALSDGTYYWRLKGTDTVGNAGTYDANYSVIIDTSILSTSVVSVAGDSSSPYWDTSNDSQTTILVDGETGMNCRWSTDDESYDQMVTDGETTCSVSGIQATCNLGAITQTTATTYHVACEDSVGNGQEANSNLDITFGVDWTAPVPGQTLVTSLSTGTHVKSPATFETAVVTDNLGAGNLDTTSCEYTIDNSTWDSGTWSGASTKCVDSSIALSAGVNTFNYRMRDQAGNLGTGTSVARTRDNDNPTGATLGFGTVTYNSITATVSGATDAGAGLHSTPYNFSESVTSGSSGFQAGTSWLHQPGGAGLDANIAYTYSVNVRDALSNTLGVASQTKFTYAKVPGISSVTCDAVNCTVNFDVNGNPAATEFFILETTGNTGGSNKPWNAVASPYIDTGITPGTQYCYRIKARNYDGVETAFFPPTGQSPICGSGSSVFVQTSIRDVNGFFDSQNPDKWIAQWTNTDVNAHLTCTGGTGAGENIGFGPGNSGTDYFTWNDAKSTPTDTGTDKNVTFDNGINLTTDQFSDTVLKLKGSALQGNINIVVRNGSNDTEWTHYSAWLEPFNINPRYVGANVRYRTASTRAGLTSAGWSNFKPPNNELSSITGQWIEFHVRLFRNTAIQTTTDSISLKGFFIDYSATSVSQGTACQATYYRLDTDASATESFVPTGAEAGSVFAYSQNWRLLDATDKNIFFNQDGNYALKYFSRSTSSNDEFSKQVNIQIKKFPDSLNLDSFCSGIQDSANLNIDWADSSSSEGVYAYRLFASTTSDFTHRKLMFESGSTTQASINLQTDLNFSVCGDETCSVNENCPADSLSCDFGQICSDGCQLQETVTYTENPTTCDPGINDSSLDSWCENLFGTGYACIDGCVPTGSNQFSDNTWETTASGSSNSFCGDNYCDAGEFCPRDNIFCGDGSVCVAGCQGTSDVCGDSSCSEFENCSLDDSACGNGYACLDGCVPTESGTANQNDFFVPLYQTTVGSDLGTCGDGFCGSGEFCPFDNRYCSEAGGANITQGICVNGCVDPINDSLGGLTTLNCGDGVCGIGEHCPTDNAACETGEACISGCLPASGDLIDNPEFTRFDSHRGSLDGSMWFQLEIESVTGSRVRSPPVNCQLDFESPFQIPSDGRGLVTEIQSGWGDLNLNFGNTAFSTDNNVVIDANTSAPTFPYGNMLQAYNFEVFGGFHEFEGERPRLTLDINVSALSCSPNCTSTDLQRVSIYDYNETTGLWTRLPSTVNLDTNEVWADLNHFSLYGQGEDNDSPTVTLQTPSDSATEVAASPDFTANPSETVTNCYLQVDNASDFSSPYSDLDGVDVGTDCDYAGSEYTTAFPDDTTVYWRMKATDEAENVGVYGAAFSFATTDTSGGDGGGPTCGNDSCEAGETEASCPADCAVAPYCGDGTCDSGENRNNCPADCGTPPEVCDGRDNDHDSLVDEDLGTESGYLEQACGTCGVQICSTGTFNVTCNEPGVCGATDLVIPAYSAEAQVEYETTGVVSFNVQNNGEATTETFIVALKTDSGATIVDTTSITGLAAGDMTGGAFNIVWNESNAGTTKSYYIEADSTSVIAEADEFNNNTANFDIQFGQEEICSNLVDDDFDGVINEGCGLPNLTITSVEVGTPEYVDSELISVDFTVTVVTEYEDVDTEFIVSYFKDILDVDNRITLELIDSIRVGETITLQFVYTAPIGEVFRFEGPNHVESDVALFADLTNFYVEVDSEGNIEEVDEEDNIVTINIQNLVPDLAFEPTTTNIPASSFIGETIPVSATVVNNGDATAIAESYSVSIFVDNFVVPDSGTIAGVELISGASEEVSFNIPTSLLAEGAHVIKIKVDSLNELAESNESNNETEGPHIVLSGDDQIFTYPVFTDREPIMVGVWNSIETPSNFTFNIPRVSISSIELLTLTGLSSISNFEINLLNTNADVDTFNIKVNKDSVKIADQDFEVIESNTSNVIDLVNDRTIDWVLDARFLKLMHYERINQLSFVWWQLYGER